jgi:hypothetical protein
MLHGLVVPVPWWLNKWIVTLGVRICLNLHDHIKALDVTQICSLHGFLTYHHDFLFVFISELIHTELENGISWPERGIGYFISKSLPWAQNRRVCVLMCTHKSYVNIYIVPYVQTIFLGFV